MISSDRSRLSRRPGFSLTELLVVVGIIALLVSLLLVALGKVQAKAKETQTLATMDNVRKACEAFFLDQGRYPGPIAEEVLDAGPSLSSTENMLLDLMGGCRATTPFDRAIPPVSRNYEEFTSWHANDPDMIQLTFQGVGWRLKIVPRLIGEGPWIDGKQFGPYYTPSDKEFRAADGRQLNEPLTNQNGDAVRLPEIVDGWGQPILYTRQVRKSGPLVGAAADKPQFVMNGMQPYTASQNLGEFGRSQTQTGGGSAWSVLNAPLATRFANFAQIVRHPAFGEADDPLFTGQARGAFVLISAGADGVYFSREDGPGQPGEGMGVNVIESPSLVPEYDDIVVFGGG